MNVFKVILLVSLLDLGSCAAFLGIASCRNQRPVYRVTSRVVVANNRTAYLFACNRHLNWLDDKDLKICDNVIECTIYCEKLKEKQRP